MPLPNRRSSSNSSVTRTFPSGRERLPPPTITDEEQLVLVDEPGLDRLGRKLGTADHEIAVRSCLQLTHRFRVELSLDPRAGARCRLQRLRVDDLVG